MTVGLYINAPRPIMITDCLALPKQRDVQWYSPSNIELYDGENGELVNLVSKFYLADDNTIIAFAGTSGHIKTFLTDFPKLWKDRDLNLRPMEYLQVKDYEIRNTEGYENWDCSVLGASVVPYEGEYKGPLINNYASLNENWMFDTNNFGKCYTIGTGGEELRQFIENTDANLDKLGSAIDFTEIGYLFNTLGGLNGRALFAQQTPPEKQTWGGLLQAHFFMDKEHGWVRTPPWFHLSAFYKGKDLSFRGIHKKVVFHSSQPGEINNSVVITGVMKDDGKVETMEWPVSSPFVPEKAPRKMKQFDVLDLPNLITITAFVGLNEERRVNSSTYHADQVDGISFNNDNNSFSWNINGEVLGEWLRQEMLNDPSIAFWLK